jgi:hypothetical protein
VGDEESKREGERKAAEVMVPNEIDICIGKKDINYLSFVIYNAIEG